MVFRNKEKQALLDELIYLCDSVLNKQGFKKSGKNREFLVTPKYDTYYQISSNLTCLTIELLSDGNTKSHSLKLDLSPWEFEYNVRILSSYWIDGYGWKRSDDCASFANEQELNRVLSDWIKSIRTPLQVKLYLDILQNSLKGVYY